MFHELIDNEQKQLFLFLQIDILDTHIYHVLQYVLDMPFHLENLFHKAHNVKLFLIPKMEIMDFVDIFLFFGNVAVDVVGNVVVVVVVEDVRECDEDTVDTVVVVAVVVEENEGDDGIVIVNVVVIVIVIEDKNKVEE